MEVPLTDLQGKGNFSIRSFAGKSVILLVVSDACPSCVVQLSREIDEIERVGEVQNRSITFVVLDIDPPGDQGFIVKYHDRFNFTGYTARSSEIMTLKLLKDLGPLAIDTEVVPVVLICPDGQRGPPPARFKAHQCARNASQQKSAEPWILQPSSRSRSLQACMLRSGLPVLLSCTLGYLSFLAGRAGNKEYRLAPFTLGILVAVGVIIAMLTGGLLFSLAMQAGGGAVNDIFTPVAFVILLIFSLVLIFDISFGQISLPNPVSRLENPVVAAFFLGLMFGIIILPCNAAAVVVLIALASTASGLGEGLGAFLSFGLGIILPLLILAGLSQAMSRQVTGYLTRYQRGVRLISGIIMLIISLWYLTLLFLPQMIQ